MHNSGLWAAILNIIIISPQKSNTTKYTPQKIPLYVTNKFTGKLYKNDLQLEVRNNNTVHSYFGTLNQQKKQKLLVRTVSRSSRPLKNDLVARCSEAYVMKDAKIKPPTTIKPNLWKEETCVYPFLNKVIQSLRLSKWYRKTLPINTLQKFQ